MNILHISRNLHLVAYDGGGTIYNIITIINTHAVCTNINNHQRNHCNHYIIDKRATVVGCNRIPHHIARVM